jgi:hypothetical protein
MECGNRLARKVHFSRADQGVQEQSGLRADKSFSRVANLDVVQGIKLGRDSEAPHMFIFPSIAFHQASGW